MTWVCVALLAFISTQSSGSPADRYLRAMTEAMESGATEAAVDRVLALFTTDAVYEHPAFGARVAGLDAMRVARMGQLGKTRRPHSTVVSRTALRDVEAITVDLTFEARDGDRWRPIARRQLLVFEYKGGQIVRLVEYWEQ